MLLEQADDLHRRAGNGKMVVQIRCQIRIRTIALPRTVRTLYQVR